MVLLTYPGPMVLELKFSISLALQTWKKKAEVQIAEDAKAIKEGSKKIVRFLILSACLHGV